MPQAERPSAGAIAVLEAYYHTKSGDWLGTMPAADLISALPWTQQIIIPKDRYIEMLDLHPNAHDYLHVPEMRLSMLISSRLERRRLTLEEYQLFVLWMLGRWVHSDDEDRWSNDQQYPGNAEVAHDGTISLPYSYTVASVYHLRRSGEPPLAIVSLGPKGATLVPRLCEAAEKEWCEFDAITLLAIMANTTDEAADALVEFVGRGNRFAQIGAVVHMGARAVPRLSRLLEDADPQVRKQAMVTLEELGPRAAGCQAAVLKMLREDDSDVVWGALNVLAANPPARDDLLQHVEDLVRAGSLQISCYGVSGETTAVGLAAKILSGVGDEAKPRVSKLLKDEDYQVRNAAAEILKTSFSR